MTSEDTSVTSDVDTFPYEVAGRSIVCRHLSDGQMMMYQRLLGRWRGQMATAEGEALSELIAQVNTSTLDLIEALIVSPDDLAFIEQQMLLGKVGVPQLRAILAGGKTETVAPVADDAPVVRKAAKKAARRPVKATKAAKATKKAAAKR